MGPKGRVVPFYTCMFSLVILFRCTTAIDWACNFEIESSPLCGLAQHDVEDIFWKRMSGPTSSAGTGPDMDHTTLTTSGHYIYVEASDGRKGDIARISEVIHTEGPSTCISLWYHMYGANTGTFRVWLSYPPYTWKLFEVSKVNEPSWVHMESAFTMAVDLGTQILFVLEAVLGSNWESDIAVDDISIKQCDNTTDAQQVFAVTLENWIENFGQASSEMYQLAEHAFTCNFEYAAQDVKGICGFQNGNRNSADFWLRDTGNAGNPGTGPHFDSTFEGNTNSSDNVGFYVWSGWSQPGPNDKALLQSPLFLTSEPSEQICLRFAFLMKGQTMGGLRVLYSDFNSVQTELWRLDGQPPVPWFWQLAHTTFPSSGQFHIIFEGTKGNGDSSEIAIDDIDIRICSGAFAYTPCHGELYCSAVDCSQQIVAPNANIFNNTAYFGEQVAVPYSWPWQAAIVHVNNSNICGGILIHPFYVITTAHCISGLNPADVVARFGEHNLKDKDFSRVDYLVEKVVCHPQYDEETREADICLIHLAVQVSLQKEVQPICLPVAGESDGPKTRCIITGWDMEDGQELLEAEIVIQDHQQCTASHDNIFDGQICAQTEVKNTSCRISSGSSLVCFEDGVWLLRGTSAFEQNCDSGTISPGIYTQTTYYMKWLEDTMAQISYSVG